MTTARKYYTESELIDDARYWRDEETEYRLRARTELNPSVSLRLTNAAKMRAEASENELRSRAVAAEQIARSGVK